MVYNQRNPQLSPYRTGARNCSLISLKVYHFTLNVVCRLGSLINEMQGLAFKKSYIHEISLACLNPT